MATLDIHDKGQALEHYETLKQTAASKQLIQQLKTYAAIRDMLMKELYEQAIFSLIKHRKDLQEEGREVTYFASPKDGKELNLVMRKTLSRRVTQIAEMDKTSVRRFLFTALMHFSNEHHLDELEVKT